MCKDFRHGVGLVPVFPGVGARASDKKSDTSVLAPILACYLTPKKARRNGLDSEKMRSARMPKAAVMLRTATK